MKTIVDETTGTTLPAALPQRMLIAQPRDGSPAIALATNSRLELDEHLERAGIDPQTCAIGTMPVSGADFVVAWDRTIHVDAAA